jgi:hypothetical protein
MIRTRAQWVTLRDRAGVKSGLVKGVEIGPMLDAYFKAGVGKAGIAAQLAQVKTVTPLINGLKKYKAALPHGNALAPVVDEMIVDLQKQIDLGAKLANPMANVSSYLTKTIAHAKVVAVSGDATAYGKLWMEDVRGVGTGLGKLATLDPEVADIRAVWLPYTTGDWDTAGNNVTKGIVDPAAKKAKIQAAAKRILGIAMKVQSDMKAKKMMA